MCSSESGSAICPFRCHLATSTLGFTSFMRMVPTKHIPCSSARPNNGRIWAPIIKVNIPNFRYKIFSALSQKMWSISEKCTMRPTPNMQQFLFDLAQTISAQPVKAQQINNNFSQTSVLSRELSLFLCTSWTKPSTPTLKSQSPNFSTQTANSLLRRNGESSQLFNWGVIKYRRTWVFPLWSKLKSRKETFSTAFVKLLSKSTLFRIILQWSISLLTGSIS